MTDILLESGLLLAHCVFGEFENLHQFITPCLVKKEAARFLSNYGRSRQTYHSDQRPGRDSNWVLYCMLTETLLQPSCVTILS